MFNLSKFINVIDDLYMNIRIQNLGAIKDACIDLNKKLTVFCGPNNTGKTYVSYIIYALTSGETNMVDTLSDNQINSFINEKSLELNLNIDEIYSFRLRQLLIIKDRLDSIFGISKDKAKSYFGDFNISYMTTKEEFQEKIISENFVLKISFYDFQIELSKESNSNRITVKNISDKVTSNDNTLSFARFMLLSIVYHCLAFYPNTTATIFPVERNSIYTFNKELSIQRNTLVEQMQELSTNKKTNPLDLLLKRTTRYPKAIRDGLEIADDLVNIQNSKSLFYDFADELESELLNGKVSVSKDGEVQFASDRAKMSKIPIHLSASIVKTLASLTFYLRYLAKENDLLIIDEPELNLHPDSQIILTRIFAQLLNRGFRLLISTHSDYIIRELNNLIMLSTATEAMKKKAKELRYKDDEHILSTDVNVYLFNYRSRGKVSVKSIPVEDSGFEVETIDMAINSLNKISEELFYTMKYGEDEK